MRKSNKFNRFISALLAAVMCIGMIPAGIVPAKAAEGVPESLVFEKEYAPAIPQYETTIDNWKVPAYGGGEVGIHIFSMKDPQSGQSYPAFCTEHGKHIPTATESCALSWTKSSDDPDLASVAWILDWYYHKYNRGEFGSSGMNDWNAQLANVAVQAAVWLWQEGSFTLTADMDCNSQEWKDMVRPIAEERVAVYRAYYGDDYPGVEDSMDFFRWMWANWQDGKFDKGTYSYYSPGRAHQDMLVQTNVGIPFDEPHDAWISLSKTDENGNPMAGAVFTVYTDQNCTTQAMQPNNAGPAVFTTRADGTGAVQVQWRNGYAENTFWVKETKAPSGYVLRGTKYPVTVNAATNNSRATAAQVNGGIPIENKTHQPPSAFLSKVDARDGQGIGPATFHFDGTGVSGQHYSFDLDCDANGNLDLQWNNPDGDKYIEPGEYTVTEIRAPLDYEITDTQGKHLKLWLDWDEETEAYDIPRSSGPLVFQDYGKHKIILKKVSADGPLAGATFEIYRNGNLLTTVTTGADGTVTYAGEDGQGLESGSYKIVETDPPPGFMIPQNPVRYFTIDTSDKGDTEHVVTMENFEWPEIVIEKKETGTDDPLAGALFEIEIDGVFLGTERTDRSGRIIISYARYGNFWNVNNETHTVRVREIEAPDGYPSFNILLEDGFVLFLRICL